MDDYSVLAGYRDFDDLWGPFAAGVGHSGSLYVSLTPSQQNQLRDEAYKRLGSPSGPFELSARVRSIRGRV